MRYLYPGTFVDDGGTTPWERVPTPMYVQAAGFVGSVNAFCGNVQRQFPTIYLAQWPVYRIGRWNRPRWRWHGGPMGPMHGGPMPHFPGPGPFTH